MIRNSLIVIAIAYALLSAGVVSIPELPNAPLVNVNQSVQLDEIR